MVLKTEKPIAGKLNFTVADDNLESVKINGNAAVPNVEGFLYCHSGGKRSNDHRR